MSRTCGAAEAASPARPTSIDGAHGPSPRREPMYGAEATERSLYSRRAIVFVRLVACVGPRALAHLASPSAIEDRAVVGGGAS
jgi:hypothetical protein